MTEVKGTAFIIRLIPAQEADVVVRLLTSDGEKMSAFARAGLKSRKRFGGALEALNHIVFRAVKRSSQQDLFNLEEAQVRHDFQKIKSDLDRLTAASYMAEVIEHSSQEGLEHPEIYNLFGAALRALEQGAPVEGVVRQFEVKLLSLMGWLPSLNQCASCGSTGRDLTLNPEQGVTTCRDCGVSAIPVTRDVQAVLGKLLQTSILKSEVQDKEARQVERLTSALLQSHWGSHRLKSADFLSSLRRFQK